MDALAARFLASLDRNDPDADVLRAVGEPDPPAAARALQAAAGHPDLRAARSEWIPALLRAARPGFAARCLETLAERWREEHGGPLDVVGAPALAPLLGASNFLARLLLRHPGWASDLVGELPAPPEPGAPEPDWSSIRRAKYRALLRIAARDVAGRPLAGSLRELSDLADGCLRAALDCAVLESGVPAPALLALGKLGGRELNFSSDVDLLFIYDTTGPDDDLERNPAVSSLIRRFKTGLEQPTAEGFGYRVDLDLRPEGRAGVLANSVDAALGYYESFGAEWERQMLIRLRPLAGPADVGTAFAASITPFVYRRLIDPGVMEAVRDMKLRIEEERRGAGRDLEYDLKEGPGGIRDVEFLVQSFQLFHGGRHPELRTGNVSDVLDALHRLGLLPENVTEALDRSYAWLRRAEHALQLVEEQQTQRFPRDAVGQLGLARRMGYVEAEADKARSHLLDDWTAVRSEVREHFESLVLRSDA